LEWGKSRFFILTAQFFCKKNSNILFWLDNQFINFLRDFNFFQFVGGGRSKYSLKSQYLPKINTTQHT